MKTIESIVVMFVGLAGGIAVGGGFVAFLTVFGLIPRLTQLTKSAKYIPAYEMAVVLGASCGGWFSLQNTVFHMSDYWLVPLGLACGTFIGMLAAALTEVLNVLPILAKRVGVYDKIVLLLMAMVLGKILGSLFHWIYFIEK
ncbi:stage V sporulation protein AB [Bacillus sp. 165]|uniref:stage V sporulation protein AB n=1 Tax=Bacillus sp. 165 TaxID=1529117 RepID=UPI0024683444|nr:stage V sporulation protein AB [Bacillus sp. 165]